jgi:NAD(P)-dependent dehydrogenase (short-subunit alcohol dehydrogenase family)
MQRLKGKIAVVTGASRNLGQGIARVLGEEGATVYVTGRSVRGNQTRLSQKQSPTATLEDTAEQVTARGGVCITVRCDHSVDEQVEALFERVKQEQGRLDILVNNAWGGYEGFHDAPAPWEAPFWEQPIWRWDKMFTVGVRSHMVSSHFAVPLMLPQRQGLIINTTVGVRDMTGYSDQGEMFYWLAKAAINGMVYGIAQELREYNIAVVGLCPGFIRVLGILAMYETDDLNAHKVLPDSESTEYGGRAVVALATDPNVMEKTGCLLGTRQLGREYGFTDVDGRHPPLG